MAHAVSWRAFLVDWCMHVLCSIYSRVRIYIYTYTVYGQASSMDSLSSLSNSSRPVDVLYIVCIVASCVCAAPRSGNFSPRSNSWGRWMYCIQSTELCLMCVWMYRSQTWTFSTTCQSQSEKERGPERLWKINKQGSWLALEIPNRSTTRKTWNACSIYNKTGCSSKLWDESYVLICSFRDWFYPLSSDLESRLSVQFFDGREDKLVLLQSLLKFYSVAE